MKQFFLFIFLLANMAFAQDKAQVTGKILDGEMNNDPMFGATVVVQGTTTGAQTDFDGIYSLELAAGTYILEFSYVGYGTIVETITLAEGEKKEINKTLKAAADALEEIVLTGNVNRESQNALDLAQQKATSIKQAIGAQEMSNKGISDAAGAVAKISGVSKQEGSSSVYVRGLGDRYLNTTLNGLSLPSNKIENKNIDLNLFSSDVIKNVAVSKAFNSKLYGDFAAGNVDIVSKEYTGKGFFDASVNTGFNTNAIGKNFVKSDGTGSLGFYTRYEHNPYSVVMSHGVDPVEAGSPINSGISLVGGKSFDFENNSRLSFFITAGFENDYRYRKGLTANYAGTYTKLFPQAEEYEYSTTTNAMLNLTYKATDKIKFKFNSLFINSSSDEVGYYGSGGQGFNWDSQSGEERGFYQMNVQFNQDKIFVNQLLGEHKINDKLDIDWGIGINNVFANQPDRKRISLEDYHFALDDNPNTNPVFFTNNAFDNQRYFQKVDDTEFTSYLRASYKTSEEVTINLGLNGRSKERNFQNSRYGYEIIDTSLEVTDVNNLNSIFNMANQGVLYNTYVINAISPENGVGQTNLPGLVENTYKGNLNVLAGYISADINVNEKLLIVPGVRLESIDLETTYDVINVSATDPGVVNMNETLFLPSLNAKYKLSDDANLRFAFSKTASLPEFKEIAPFVYVGVTDRIGGNPDLINSDLGSTTSKVFNFDVKYEWFFNKGELLSLAGFAKQIHDPINLVTAIDATGTERYFRTGDKADIFGVELDVRKILLRDSEEDAKLTAGLNATYMHTKQDLKASNGTYSVSFDRSSDQLQGASPFIVNSDISYKPTFGNYKPMANLIFTYFSDRIYSLGAGSISNKVEKGFASLDFVLKNKIGENAELNFSAKNLLDPSIKIIREDVPAEGGDVTLSEYKRGINIGLQFKYKF
ncbi:TonB-dependent receptor [Pseudofulvibacter geojedonensis]|uniref:TonB-dependent receptor domain-containing protein n=1 Tax=Pseudofulvibacter geojedonensis TaxID=1123758 RepID=A0ABW3I3V8_9FLAO